MTTQLKSERQNANILYCLSCPAECVPASLCQNKNMITTAIRENDIQISNNWRWWVWEPKQIIICKKSSMAATLWQNFYRFQHMICQIIVQLKIPARKTFHLQNNTFENCLLSISTIGLCNAIPWGIMGTEYFPDSTKHSGLDSCTANIWWHHEEILEMILHLSVSLILYVDILSFHPEAWHHQ